MAKTRLSGEHSAAGQLKETLMQESVTDEDLEGDPVDMRNYVKDFMARFRVGYDRRRSSGLSTVSEKGKPYFLFCFEFESVSAIP